MVNSRIKNREQKTWKKWYSEMETASSEAVAVCENCLRLLDKRTIIKQANDY
jgi:hypothetical protein